nr:N-6 DNA methylase [uncultured Fretibacterium sp.]
MPKAKRKRYGQFFTSKETAIFMAGLFVIPQDRGSLTILDPGAGSGILSIALLERLESIAAIDSIELVCYENDSNIIDLLRSNLEWTCKRAAKAISYKIITDNYILSQMVDYNCMLGANPNADKFDMIIGNPPYMKVRKAEVPPSHIRITTTRTNRDFSEITVFDAPYDTVVSGADKYVYLVTNPKEADTLEKLNNWHYTLPKLGIPMKTGLTVDFRNRDALRNQDEEEAVPLFYSQHIKDGRVVFPIGKECEYIVTDQPGLLQDNVNYLFVKRFTAKEERRRLQCGVYLSRKYPRYSKISTQNKINFIGGMKELSECIVYGLYVLFNSTLYDSYYRILNGSTQVNSTEINSMPVPSLTTIGELGKSLIASHDTSEQSCDEILRSYIYDQDRRSKNYRPVL